MRILLALLCLWRWRQGRERLALDLSLPGYAQLRDALMPRSERIGVQDAAPEALPQFAAGPLRGDAYLDWSVGLGTSVLGSAVQLKFASTNIEGSAGCDLCDGRLVLSLSKTF